MAENPPDWAFTRMDLLVANEPQDGEPQSYTRVGRAFARFIAANEADPLMQEAREFAEARGWYTANLLESLRAGRCDNSPLMQDLIAALRRGIEIERERGL